MTPVELWGASGTNLLRVVAHRDLIALAALAASIHTQALMLLMSTGTVDASPALLDAKSAAPFIGPWCTAKWLYNHVHDLPPDCVHRIGRRVLFVGPRLREWAVTVGRNGQTVTRRGAA